MNCNYCHSIVNERYRVNQRGDIFCDDECYGEYLDDHETPDDFNHPYIDDYELIRSNYLDWIENWEADLEPYSGKGISIKITEMVETIDEVFDEYWDYYMTEGDDGSFAKEIYYYLLKFEDLKKVILSRRPQ